MKTIKIKLDMNSITDRTIIAMFYKLAGIKSTIEDLAGSAYIYEKEAWELVHKSFPDTKFEDAVFNIEKKELTFKEDEPKTEKSVKSYVDAETVDAKPEPKIEEGDELKKGINITSGKLSIKGTAIDDEI